MEAHGSFHKHVLVESSRVILMKKARLFDFMKCIYVREKFNKIRESKLIH